MSNNRSKLLVDIANSGNNALCVSEAQDLINYIDEVHEGIRMCTEKDNFMHLEHRSLEVASDRKQAAKSHSDGEQNDLMDIEDRTLEVTRDIRQDAEIHSYDGQTKDNLMEIEDQCLETIRDVRQDTEIHSDRELNKNILKDIENRSLEVTRDIRLDAETHSDGEQNKENLVDIQDSSLEVTRNLRQADKIHNDGAQTSNLLSQTDLNYIIDSVGELSNEDIEHCLENSLNLPICENETPQLIPNNSVFNKESDYEDNSTPDILSRSEPFDSTPMPSPNMLFGDIDNDCNSLSESTVLLSDTTLGSSDMSTSSTPRRQKKKRL